MEEATEQASAATITTATTIVADGEGIMDTKSASQRGVMALLHAVTTRSMLLFLIRLLDKRFRTRIDSTNHHWYLDGRRLLKRRS